MARSNPAEIGDNSEPLTDDERADLIAFYGQKIRTQERKAAEAKAAYDLERTEVKNLFALVKGDLQISRKDFEDLLGKQDMTEAEFRNFTTKRDALYRLSGLPVGAQIDMFSHADTVDDQAQAEANGYRAGVRGDEGIAPEHIAPILRGNWEHGWGRGQAELGARMERASALLAKRGEPDADDDGIDLNEEEEDPTDPEVIAEKTRKLKRAGFMDRSEPEEVAA